MAPLFTIIFISKPALAIECPHFRLQLVWYYALHGLCQAEWNFIGVRFKKRPYCGTVFDFAWYGPLIAKIFLFFLTENISSKQQVEVTNTPPPPATAPQAVIIQKSPSKSSRLDVDNFVPETDAIENFLDEQDSSTADRLAVMNMNGERERDIFYIFYFLLHIYVDLRLFDFWIRWRWHRWWYAKQW